MTFEPAKYPNAVTIAHLIAEGMQMEAHCLTCGYYKLLKPESLGLPPETPVPSIKSLICSRCGSRETQARPHYEQKAMKHGY